MRSKPNLIHELALWKKGYLVVGIDEVGRGSFAGPIVVGGVILRQDLNINQLEKLKSLGINDSKKLSGQKRRMIIEDVQEFILHCQYRIIDVDKINEIGIGKANIIAMQLLAKNLLAKFFGEKMYFLTDAFPLKNVPENMQKNIIGGDGISTTIALASIFAKEFRDKIMIKKAKQYPNYGFEKNKGYGTLEHRNKLKLYGPSSTHRTEFIKKHL